MGRHTKTCAGCGLPGVLVRGRQGLMDLLKAVRGDLEENLAQPWRELRPINGETARLESARWLLRVSQTVLAAQEAPALGKEAESLRALAHRLRDRIRRQARRNRKRWNQLKEFMKRVEQREVKAIQAMDLDTLTEYFKNP